MILAIDIGNTRTKFGVYEEKGEKTLLDQGIFLTKELAEKFPGYLKNFPPDTSFKVGWISTATPVPLDEWPVWSHFHRRPAFFPITAQSDLPIQNDYSTPETLGADRIVAVIGACSYCKGKPVLVIDAGTAITYDVARADGTYLGGAIAPGMEMRFKALHHFTARLPKVEAKDKAELIGSSTEESIQSGVINGTTAELTGMIKQYRKALGKDTQVFITGGDRHFFEKRLKKLNFATSNLVLEGIFTILKYKASL